MSKPSGSDQSATLSTDGKQDTKATILRLWNYYLEKLDKNPKLLTLTPLRESKAKKRLAECLRKTGGDLGNAEELMCICIDTLGASSFHRGKNDRKRKYDSWEDNLFKSQEQMEKWLERAGE